MSKVETLKHYLRLVNTKKPKSCYIGWVGYKNLGDEILYDAHKELFPDANFHLYLRSKLLDKVFIKAHDYQSVFLGGGTLINQANVWLDTLKQFDNSNTPMYCFGTGVVSPEFWNSNKDWNWQDRLTDWADMLKKFEYVGVRGPMSCKQLTDLGVKAEVLGDTAMTLAPDSCVRPTLGKKPVIGVNVGFAKGKMWGNENEFIKEIGSMVSLFVKEGYKVKLLPVWDADIEINENIIKAQSNSSVDLILNYENYGSYIEEIKSCDVFVGEKLHATVIATLQRVPSIMIEYRPKCLEYMTSIGMEDYCMSTGDFSALVCVEKVKELIDEREAVSQRLEENILYYKFLQAKRAKELSLVNS
ncbi:MAG: polysaccharide pyruvyl transferase family protein [Moritella sp.]|uniref:polysaccharide pyruvyl transferase family protein n=1 Tax=Moritella sp. TaxID=78556 RepID=UPI001D7BA4E1|nr:polysaccharide pyruvyl transferase family protein [Moritella sp.]NQZ52232.1 polysaccharide pyruvyl transferase family protein [Moritella sp.]